MGSPRPSRWVVRARAGALAVAGLALLAACSDTSGSSAPTSSSRSTSTSVAASGASAAAARCTPPTDVTRPVVAAGVGTSGSDHDITSFDGTRIRAHWFPVADATPQDPRPTVLMGPGWGMAGDADPTSVGILGSVSIRSLNEAGFNVLTWDPRGFGESSGTAEVDAAGAEGRDVQELIEWVSEQPGVELDGPSDPRMGMVGGSYGGGIQLITAAIDCRVDAIVPIVAWHSLTTSLFKARTVKLGWAGILSSVTARASVDPVVADSYQQGVETGTISSSNATWFAERGPGDLVERVKVPTLIIQGTVDTLFTLDEGVTNYRILRDRGVPVAMLWFCGGHGACLTDPGDPARVGQAAIAWLDRWVARDAGARPVATFDVVAQDGTRYTADDLPRTSAELTGSGSGTLQLTEAGGAGPPQRGAAAGDVVGGLALDVTPAPAANAVDVEIKVGDRPRLVLGAPTLRLTYSGTARAGERPTRVFAQLVDPSTGLVLGNQITPVAVDLDGRTHHTEVPLEWVAFRARAGSSITLQVVASTVAYAPPRMGGRIHLRDVEVSLPVVTGMRPG